MRKTKLTLLAILFLCFSQVNAQSSKVETMKDFLKGILSLENVEVNSQQPIISINELAKDKAAKTITISKENIQDALADAKEFKYCLLTVGNHTIVKITDLANCSPSGSWGACMPYGEGYVQKGDFVKKEDYIKNIIGRPDAQVRTMYLFN